MQTSPANPTAKLMPLWMIFVVTQVGIALVPYVMPLTVRETTAELFDAERCGCFSNQLPVLADIISSSSGEKRQIVAERRMPPLSTARAVNMQMS